MKVRELIDLLKTLNQDALVVLSKDAEGNSYSPVPNGRTYSAGLYTPNSTWEGEFLSNQDASDLVRERMELPKGAVPAVVLWPTN